MRIVLDMQGAQTESRFRGIGRYTLSFAQAIVRNRGKHTVILALSSLLPDAIDSIRAAFQEVLPADHICVWHAVGPVREDTAGNEERREIAEIVREAFLAGLEPDLIHITSLFEGHFDESVGSIGRFDAHTPVSVSLYDLIPLLNAEHYFKFNPMYEAHYLRKLGFLKRSAACLGISEFATHEGRTHLDKCSARFVNVSTAIEPYFRRVDIDDDAAALLQTKFGLNRPFVLYTGGSDGRKNLPRLIQAFARLKPQLRSRYQLLLAGKMPQQDITALHSTAEAAGLEPNQLQFTGYVSDVELVQLFNLCRLFVFPSWHEGFGLPALEALACGAPVIAANTSSLPEVIGFDDALFDPFDTDDISAKITRALEDESFRTTLRKHGLQRAAAFSWDETAKRAIATWEEVHAISKHHRSVLQSGGGDAPSTRAAALYRKQVAAIASQAGAVWLRSETNLRRLAACLHRNERQTHSTIRSTASQRSFKWRIEGPFDSSYSLALVNRETARALSELGHDVALHSTEGPGDFPADKVFLQQNPDLAALHEKTCEVTADAADVTSRNLYPPRVVDMHSKVNLLHAYGWEESGFPQEWVRQFNANLTGITVMSKHVRKVMIDNGVTVPLAVSGIGVDHWERTQADATFHLSSRASFRFLHVSSCFPRKGADVLLKAFKRAFRADDDVELVIKTFANPHNQIHAWLTNARAGDSGFPAVQILEGDYTDAQIKALYEQCDALVAPSRAEGFGLPMAEAMLSGLPVIATGWSGQTDFCTARNSWLIDYRFARAETHFGLASSAWAEPDIAHLATLMREVYEAPEMERASRAAAGRKLLLERFRWLDTATVTSKAAHEWSVREAQAVPRIGWVSSWNTRCGIASYSAHLLGATLQNVKILAARASDLTAADQPNVERCWNSGVDDPLADLRHAIDASSLDVIMVQFNYSFFDFPKLAGFLIEQVDAGRVVVVMMHSTHDAAQTPHKKLATLSPALARCHRVLVHAIDDLNRLKDHGLVTNVALFPHGILDQVLPSSQGRVARPEFVVASYGYFLPHKGLLELIDAVALMRQNGVKARLNMVNAEYPAPESTQTIELARQKIRDTGLSDVVSLKTSYLSDVESLQSLRDADLIVFPYQETGESSSAAVRYGIASGQPVAVTPLAIFDDVRPAVHYLPGRSVRAIAEGLSEIAEDFHSGGKELAEKESQAQRWREEHRYSGVAIRLQGILLALFNAELENKRRELEA